MENITAVVDQIMLLARMKEIRRRTKELHTDEGWTLREARALAIAELGGSK